LCFSSTILLSRFVFHSLSGRVEEDREVSAQCILSFGVLVDDLNFNSHGLTVDLVLGRRLDLNTDRVENLRISFPVSEIKLSRSKLSVESVL